ncbi:MAG: shikimate kinase [Pirellulales bacterium]|nr:shikimate kinase [Pirellulales bacterium]
MAPSSLIALIGFRGTGKTTAAQLLAVRLGYDWVDADVEVELRAGRSIATIFAESGEDAFRDLEETVLSQLYGREKTVLALGGGAILRETNRQCLAGSKAVVWLRASAAVIAKRLADDPTSAERRPNLTNHGGRTEIEELLLQREPIYRACATLEVDTDNKAPMEIADEIFAAIGDLG